MPSIALKYLAQKTLIEQTADGVFLRSNKEIRSQPIILVFYTKRGGRRTEGCGFKGHDVRLTVLGACRGGGVSI